jgi:enamine deaminase RidA (YjgF/YER057c/UK114 family)
MSHRFIRYRVFPLLVFCYVVCCVVLLGAKKKDRELSTQTLKEPKEPPAIATGEGTRLVFHVSPLSAKGLLSQQTRDALSAILRANGGAPVVHLRAFVAGSGDLRRIPQITSEIFTRKNLPLPSVSVVQVGALPLEGAQVVIEAVSEARKPANPNGVSFIPLQDSVDHLAARLGSAGALAVTCFVDDVAKASGLASKFPGAAFNVVQTQRLPPRPITGCEAVVRGGKAGRYAFSGTQAAFGFEEKDAKLAFQRIGRDLEAAGIAPGEVVETRVYALTKPIADMALRLRTIQGEAVSVPVEGVAGSDASFAVDVVAMKP